MKFIWKAYLIISAIIVVIWGCNFIFSKLEKPPERHLNEKKVWSLKRNNAKEWKSRLEDYVTRLREELKEAPYYIQNGLKVLEERIHNRDAAVEKAVQSLKVDSQ